MFNYKTLTTAVLKQNYLFFLQNGEQQKSTCTKEEK